MDHPSLTSGKKDTESLSTLHRNSLSGSLNKNKLFLYRSSAFHKNYYFIVQYLNEATLNIKIAQVVVFIFQNFHSSRFQSTHQWSVLFEDLEKTRCTWQLYAVYLVAEELSFGS